MKSIKRGRGPSAFGVFGDVLAAVFGVFWMITAAQMGAPRFFVLFGVIFVAAAVGQGIYNYINATSKNRFSEYDITDDTEESDAYSDISGKEDENSELDESAEADWNGDSETGHETDCEPYNELRYGAHFCSNCGAPLDKKARFCSNCGKKIS